MAESTVLEDIDTGKLDGQFRYFKAKVFDDHKAKGTDYSLKKVIDNVQVIVFTGKFEQKDFVVSY